MSETEKSQKPTPKKLLDARKRGEVVRSADVVSALVFVGGLLAVWGGVRFIIDHVHAQLAYAASIFAARDPSERIVPFAYAMLMEFVFVSLPFLAVAGACSIAGSFLQVGGLVAWAKIKPDSKHLNPGEGLKRLFSIKSLVNLAKMLVKIILLTAVIYSVIRSSLDVPIKAGYSPAADILVVAAKLLSTLFGWAAVVYVLMAAVDYIHVHHEFMKQQRMSIEEVRREFKENEGDPHIRGRRRSMAMEQVAFALVDRVAMARVVVYSHRYALALCYAGGDDLPWVVARGEGEVAARIRQFAAERRVPTKLSIGTAQKLFDEVPLDRFIDRSHFAEVAEILRWAEGSGVHRRKAGVGKTMKK